MKNISFLNDITLSISEWGYWFNMSVLDIKINMSEQR